MSSAALRIVTPVEDSAHQAPAGDGALVQAGAMNTANTANTVHTPRRMLRVLSGMNCGAESEMQADRLLIGNLENECDVVLDVGQTERHVCLVRASSDGWTVLAIAGDLWLGTDYLAAQQTRQISSGLVITLGRVAFCIADPDRVDWASVKPPLNLIKPDAQGPLPHAALVPARPASMQRWRAVKLAAGVGIGVLVLSSAASYLTQAYAVRKPGPEERFSKLNADQALVSALPFGKELTLAAHPESPQRVLVQGYVPQRAQMAAVSAALQAADTDAELRLTPLDELSADLVRRFEGATADAVRYDTQGRFVVTTPSLTVATRDRQVRQALQEVPAVQGVDLRVSDLRDDHGQPVTVQYKRSAQRPGDVLVSNLDVALGQHKFKVQELRWGVMPSVVLDDGLRYFTGARLPDGSVITQIEQQRLVMTRQGGAQSEMSLADVSRTTGVASNNGSAFSQQNSLSTQRANRRK